MRKKKPRRTCSGKLTFSPYVTDPKTGKKRWAKNYGYKAWPICDGEWLDEEKAASSTQLTLFSNQS